MRAGGYDKLQSISLRSCCTKQSRTHKQHTQIYDHRLRDSERVPPPQLLPKQGGKGLSSGGRVRQMQVLVSSRLLPSSNGPPAPLVSSDAMRRRSRAHFLRLSILPDPMLCTNGIFLPTKLQTAPAVQTAPPKFARHWFRLLGPASQYRPAEGEAM